MKIKKILAITLSVCMMGTVFAAVVQKIPQRQTEMPRKVMKRRRTVPYRIQRDMYLKRMEWRSLWIWI